MSTISKKWINIEYNIKIINEVLDTDSYDIDNQNNNDVFCIDDDRESQNDLLIVPEEENNYTRREVMYYLDKKIKTQYLANLKVYQ